MELKPFKTIDLYKHLGEGDFDKLKTTSDYESLCRKLFGLNSTESYESNRGDFVKTKHYSDGTIKSKEYWDHKNCKVISEKQGGQDYFLKVKYSNVYSKLWVQMAIRELDEIMKLIPKNYKILLLRFKTEFRKQDLDDIDRYIGYYKHALRLDNKPIPETNSYCLKYDIDFYDFCDHLCRYNVRKYGNLILIHDCPEYDHESKTKIREWEDEDGVNWYTTLSKGKQYLLTPIDINKSLTYLDYIGFGGFKVVVNKFPAKLDIKPPKEMKPLLDELDLLTNIIEYQNDIDNHNQSCNLHSRLIKEHRHYKYYTKDKWNFYDFEEKYQQSLKK